MQAEAGKTCKGKVTKITKFGAFIRLEDGSNGLVHISQVSDAYVLDVQEYLTVGQAAHSFGRRKRAYFLDTQKREGGSVSIWSSTGAISILPQILRPGGDDRSV